MEDISAHGSGEVFIGGRRPSAGCAGCHSGGTFSKMIAAGAYPGQGDGCAWSFPTRPPNDCRACHQIHVTGTGADWKLETTAAVALFATPGKTFNGGSGNLCANCHQARRVYPNPRLTSAEATVAINSRFGPHHGPQSDMLIGTAGAGTTGILDGVPHDALHRHHGHVRGCQHGQTRTTPSNLTPRHAPPATARITENETELHRCELRCGRLPDRGHHQAERDRVLYWSPRDCWKTPLTVARHDAGQARPGRARHGPAAHRIGGRPLELLY